MGLIFLRDGQKELVKYRLQHYLFTWATSELLEVCWTKSSLGFRGVQKWPSLDLTLCRLKIVQYFIKSSTNEVMFDYCFFYSDEIL